MMTNEIGLTSEEMEILTPYDAAAFDLLRAESDGIQPMWLCMSDEDRQAARDRFLEFAMEKEFVAFFTDEAIARMVLDHVARESPALAAATERWRMAEAEAKRLRTAGNPNAYFAG